MNVIRHIRRTAGVLTGLACAWLGLAVAAPAAFAVPPPQSASSEQPAQAGRAVVGVAEHHESLTGTLPAPLAAHIHQPAPEGPGPVHIPVHAAAAGMPGWQIALIAAAVTVIVALVAVLAARVRTARRKAATAAA